MDNSNGYEGVARLFIDYRGQVAEGMGTSSVRRWARALPRPATVLDLGCGTGIPLTKMLLEEGLTVYGLDAAPTLVEAFRHNFPHAPVACEPVEESLFFQRPFEAIVAWGLLFLLAENAQPVVIQKAAAALSAGGRFLFTAPHAPVQWVDVLTGHRSTSLGAATYRHLLAAAGFALEEEFSDEGENYYFSARKI